jgi:hypothetical protein
MTTKTNRLTKENPIVKSLEKVFNLLEKEKISIDFDYGVIRITSTKRGFEGTYQMLDLESFKGDRDSVTNFPPTFDYKLIFDDDEFDDDCNDFDDYEV